MIQLSITDQEFRQLADYVYNKFGIYLKEEKKALVVGRLQQRLQDRGMTTFSEYYQYLLSDITGEATIELINSISTNHTFFMRESSHFQFLEQTVLPKVVQRIRDRDLRIWCAGCSTGEEAYTLAMIIQDFFADKKGWDTKLLATDISTKVLQKAVAGQYSTEAISALPNHWKINYFNKISEHQFQVANRLKQEIVFRRFNLMEQEYPFKRRFHVVFCRNVMIYFDNATKSEVLRKFYEVMEPGGYLFIGHSEGLERHQTNFRYIMPSVYQKI